MVVKLPIEEGYFHINPCDFCGINSYLIVPEVDAKWNSHNLYFRSLIVDQGGKVLSCGFPKFFNFGEKPDCYPNPESFKDWGVETKIDGSLLITDYVNSQFSMRTRGTASYKIQENASDFDLLPQKYPEIKKYLCANSHYSLLFEIVTPNNVIVIRPTDVQFYFLGAIDKRTLSLVSDSELLNIWKKIGCPPTPRKYQSDNLKELSQIAKWVKDWKGAEGIVLTYNKGQNKIKIKSDWYCWVHRIKSQLNSENNLVEYYVDCNMPDAESFFKKIENEYDYEIAAQLKNEIDNICLFGEKAREIILDLKKFASSIQSFENRKEQAKHIILTYGKSLLTPYVFAFLDEKELDKKQIIKLIFYAKERSCTHDNT